ncbi:MAG: hypothetical protein LBS41_02005 [Streptococcaceae bacterium]|nr:hypothetical protein [Streptococcaceae bacterium]
MSFFVEDQSSQFATNLYDDDVLDDWDDYLYPMKLIRFKSLLNLQVIALR